METRREVPIVQFGVGASVKVWADGQANISVVSEPPWGATGVTNYSCVIGHLDETSAAYDDTTHEVRMAVRELAEWLYEVLKL